MTSRRSAFQPPLDGNILLKMGVESDSCEAHLLSVHACMLLHDKTWGQLAVTRKIFVDVPAAVPDLNK